MAAPIRLRAWQKAALGRFEARVGSDFLTVATPGSGKTTFALAAVRNALIAREIKRFVVVVPTQHLKLQWALAAEKFDLHVDPEWSAGDGALPSDVHGVAVTYQQVASNPGALRRLVAKAFVVLDEIHHAAETRSWGDGVRHAFEIAPVRLCLSGTPFRSDRSAIPFVRYVREEAQADYEYGYAEALLDERVVRPVYFPRINGRMEWTAPDGQTHRAGFEDPLTRSLSSQRLRTALDVEGEWLRAVLIRAHRQLLHIRREDPRAAGMVIAIDQEHARGIARILKREVGVRAVVATSDDPTASHKIADFTDSDSTWIVAVRMVSEGVDIPRLRVGVYATNTATDLFFRQAVGRLVRVAGAENPTRQRAYMFIPDDPRLRTFAADIALQRRHCLRKPDRGFDDDRPDLEQEDRDPDVDDRSGQLSLFAAISAVPLDVDGRPLETDGPFHDPLPQAGGATESADLATEIPGLVRDAEKIPDEPESDDVFELVAGDVEVPTPEPDPVATPSPRTRKRRLREQNSARVRELVHRTKQRHAEVNAELNRRVGIRRITEATVAELARRLDIAERWLERIRPPISGRLR